MDREPAQVVVPDLALTGVQPGTYFDSELPSDLDDGLCASNGPSWTVERSDEPVASGTDFSSPKSPELLANRAVVSVEQRSPERLSPS